MPDFEQRQMAYQAAMALARRMLSKGLISEEQYAEIDTIIAKSTAYLRAVYSAEMAG